MITDHSPSTPVLISNALEFRKIRKSDRSLPRIDEVNRTRIRGKVGRRLGLPVVLISASAGYGKSVLAAQLVRRNPLPFVWLSLTESDNDPSRLVHSLVMGLDRIESADREPVAALRIPGSKTGESPLPELLRCMQRTAPFVLVIDDLHALSAPQGVAVVRHLVENLPPAARSCSCRGPTLISAWHGCGCQVSYLKSAPACSPWQEHRRDRAVAGPGGSGPGGEGGRPAALAHRGVGRPGSA